MVQDVIRRDPNLVGQSSPITGAACPGGKVVDQVLQIFPSYSILPNIFESFFLRQSSTAARASATAACGRPNM